MASPATFFKAVNVLPGASTSFSANIDTAATQPGDIVLIQYASYQALTPTVAITDNVSSQNVYSALSSQTASGDALQHQAIFGGVIAVGTSGSHTWSFTITGTAVANGVCQVCIFRGCKSIAYDALTFSSPSVGSVTNQATPSATVPAALSDLVIGFGAGYKGAGSFTAGTGSTSAIVTTGGGVFYKSQTLASSDSLLLTVASNGTTDPLCLATLTLRGAAISSQPLYVDGRQRPWDFYGNGVDNAGATSTNVGASAGFTDGTTATSGASTTLNTTKRYGRNHTTVGEQPTSIIGGLQAGDTVVITYMGAQGVKPSGGGSFTSPVGNGTAGYFTDANGYVFPSDYLSASGFPLVGLMGAWVGSDGSVVGTWKWTNGTGNAGDSITLTAPAGTVGMTFGVNDSNLNDNTGSWVLNVQTGSSDTLTAFMGNLTAGISSDPMHTQDSSGGLPVLANNRFNSTQANTVQGTATKYPYNNNNQRVSPAATKTAPDANTNPTVGQIYPTGK